MRPIPSSLEFELLSVYIHTKETGYVEIKLNKKFGEFSLLLDITLFESCNYTFLYYSAWDV